jgi:3-phosphoshikimate 1-carboxyvinyltransferase
MGAEIEWDRSGGVITIERSDLTGVEIDVGDTPDLLPTLAVLGAEAEGTTTLTNAAHVRYKETDRVRVMAEELRKLGAETEERPEALIIHGETSHLDGTAVDGHGDHRIVMSLAIAGLGAAGETRIRGAEHAVVSFPDFFETMASLGAAVTLE